MQLIDGAPVFSATDLVGFLACDHLTGLELAGAARLVERPVRDDPELELIRKRGYEHEARYLAGLEAAGRRATTISPDGSIEDRLAQLRLAAAETEAAIRRGDDVIYQATFFDGRWRGHADFLLRVGVPSHLGSWSYEVADTKLARHVKGSALLQICSYVEPLTRIQGREPEWMHVALGGKAHAAERFRVADYIAYFRLAKRLFEERVGATEPAYPPVGTYPDPVEHCEVCRWDEVCSGRRRVDDDLSLVAGITGRQRRALKERGIGTRCGLAGLELPLVPPLDGGDPASLGRTWRQARIQVAGDAAKPKLLHEIIAPARLRDGSLEPDRGLLSLPEPRPGDLFFDIEGDPFAFEDGIEYLFGVLEPGVAGPDGEPAFHAFWARDGEGNVTDDAERAAFERVVDLFTDRLAADPAIHIYHYAPYEPTALARLMGRHATREGEVDALLRGGVLVDLYRAVRQGIRASVESYSIKRLEPLYGYVREVELRDAGSSIVAFESWLGGLDGAHGEETLAEIERYNRDDVVSTLLLRDWLEARRVDLAAELGEPVPRRAPRSGAPSEELGEALAHVAEVAESLAPGGIDDDTPGGHGRWLLAQLLSWHRREEKSFWRRYFELMDELTDEDRVAAPEPLGELTYVGVVGTPARSEIHRYAFPPQEHEVRVGRDARDPATGKSAGTVVALGDAAGTVDLSRGVGSVAPHPRSLVPYDHVSTKDLQASLLRIGESVAARGIDGDGPYRVARDLLARLPPRAGQATGAAVLRAGEEAVDGAVRAALALDRSYLAIQGPPGSGKTYTGAQIALSLVGTGRTVGVTATSHKVIGHLLEEIAVQARKQGRPAPRIGQRTDKDGHHTFDGAIPYTSNDAALAALAAREVDVVGGTAWVWSRAEVAGSVDVLIVDEAGQMSLANVVAVSPAADSLVLLGDPQQLDQPLKGSHPAGAERSALAHLLDGTSTMPPGLGIFIEQTRRLHPDVCGFTSEAFYEGKLESFPGLERQELDGVAPLTGTGIRLVGVAHRGNANDSPEEADAVAALVGRLLDGGSSWTDADGESHLLSLDDILVITPYNAQVGQIDRRLPAGARVGTVDKFQGQQAPISIYSMATSSAAEAPRGMEFLYSLNRLNVATSRARCLAVLVASPELLRVRARTPRQMQLANALARLVEFAKPSGAAGEGTGGEGRARA